jgi:hypothetical protein
LSHSLRGTGCQTSQIVKSYRFIFTMPSSAVPDVPPGPPGPPGMPGPLIMGLPDRFP